MRVLKEKKNMTKNEKKELKTLKTKTKTKGNQKKKKQEERKIYHKLMMCWLALLVLNIKAPSTRVRIFLKPHLFLQELAFHPH